MPLSIPYFEISRKAGIPIIAEIELAYRHLKGKIIGITGSNGKTTTTTLVSDLLTGAGLKGHAAGNIGTPLIGFVAGFISEDIYAVELSSFQLESIREFRPFIGSILNLTPDHMDRYSGFRRLHRGETAHLHEPGTDRFCGPECRRPKDRRDGGEVRAKPVLFSRSASLTWRLCPQ